MNDFVTIQENEEVLVVTINRPERKNAVDGKTANRLYEVFKAFDQDSAYSVAVLTGAGGAFCAGADLKAIADSEGVNPLNIDGDLGPMGASRLRLSKPVIAAIEGHAVAGGMELALWCDLRVASETAIFGIYCRRFGVPLIDLGTIRLPRLISQSRAMDLILTGRPVKAEEAYSIGLANRVVPEGKALESAITLAKQISAFPQTCMQNDRSSVLEQWDMTEEEAIRNEMKRGLSTFKSGETLKGAAAFTQGKGRHGET